MIRSFFRIPKVEPELKKSFQAPCPRCGSGTHIHAQRSRCVSDPQLHRVHTQRRHCKACGKTLTLRPEGITRARATARTKALAFVWYILGLSYDGVVIALEAQGMSFCKQSVWGWIQVLWAQAGDLRRRVARGRVRFLGLDGTVYKVKGGKVPLQVATDLQTGDILQIEFMAEEDQAALGALLKEFKRVYGVEMLTTDDAGGYRPAAEEAGLPHQVCRPHLKKALGHRVRELLRQALQQGHPRRGEVEDLLGRLKEGVKAEAREVQHVGMEIYQAFRGARPPGKGEEASLDYRMYLLGLHVMGTWGRMFTDQAFREGEGLDGTNNATERAIGLGGKIRYRSMRGFKAKDSLKRYLEAGAWLRYQKRLAGDEGFIDLRPLFLN